MSMVRKSSLLAVAKSRPAGLKFRELRALVEAVGFELDRQAGSHLIFRHSSNKGVPRLNLQEGKAASAKPYQVKQVLRIIEEHKLGEEK